MKKPRIYLFNTLSGKKEIFKPLRKKIVTMYNCGPTVYDRAHIGNLRAYIMADVLRRVLEYNGFKVKQIINITDVGHLVSDSDTGEDKIEKRAKEEKTSAWDIAKKYENLFKKDLKKLNIQFPFKFPKATSHIKDMINLIKVLESKGYTYKISDGIYFDTSKFKNYGKLGNLKNKKLLAGARIEFNPEKKNIYDFALWKFSPSNIKRQMEWKSPWGKGFPGWHIECSAMAMKYLGQTIDIHTGGIDHIDIHHNNEIAQSEAATGKKFVKYWIHFNFVLVDNQKMSKSLGNILTLDDIENSNLNPLSYKYLILTSHYKSEFNFTFKSLNSAEIAYNGIKQYLLSQQIIFTKANKINYRLDKDEIKFKILKIINNDFDTPGLISFLWNILRSDKNLEYKKLFIYEVDKVLGLNLSKDVKSFKIPPEIKKLIFKRENLRRTKNWQEADKIREFIFLKGFKIDDIKGGVVVKKNL